MFWMAIGYVDPDVDGIVVDLAAPDFTSIVPLTAVQSDPSVAVPNDPVVSERDENTSKNLFLTADDTEFKIPIMHSGLL